MATARYVFPVPAGPMPNTRSLRSMASMYRRWFTVLGASTFLPNVRCRPLETSARRLTSGSSVTHAQIAVQIAVIEDVPFAHQRHIIFQNVLGARDVGGFAFNFERVMNELGAHFQSRLEQTDIFVPRTEQAFDSTDDGYAYFHLAGIGVLRLRMNEYASRRAPAYERGEAEKRPGGIPAPAIAG